MLKVMKWPKLVAGKVHLKCRSGSSRFLADSTNIVEASPAECEGTTSTELSITGNQNETRTYKLYVSTWNVGGLAPPDNLNLEDWLDTCNNPCDIYVLGFQEIVPLNAGTILGITEKSQKSTKWNSLIRAALNKCSASPAAAPIRAASKKKLQEKFTETGDKQKVYPYDQEGDTKSAVTQDFKCIISKQMVGIFVSVWVRANLRRFISKPGVVSVGCGIMGCLGNKGSVSVRFRLHETNLCFVCTHLASGGNEGDEMRRNSNAREIMSRTAFPQAVSSFHLPKKILDHDQVVWLGDLNYRISMPTDTIRLLVDKSRWDILLKKDQLKNELSKGGTFEGWHEGDIGFAPTYKYNPDSDMYYGGNVRKKGEKKRAPAWCDRILWHGNGMKQMHYLRGESRLSDHRAVRAIFSVETNKIH